jgi:hypothetical protein
MGAGLSDAQLLDRLSKHPGTIRHYRASRHSGDPCAETIMHRFGSWNAALALIGEPVNSLEPPLTEPQRRYLAAFDRWTHTEPATDWVLAFGAAVMKTR